MDDKKLYDYSLSLAEFVTIVLRVIRGHPAAYELSTTHDQREAGIRLYSALCSKGIHVLDELHHFLFLMTAIIPREWETNMWSCPITSYFAVSAFRADCRFISAGDFTHRLAEWKYHIRSIVVMEGCRIAPNHPEGIIG